MRETLNQRKDSQELMREMMRPYLNSEMKLYDVGCGEKPFAKFLTGKVASHIGVDVDHGFYDKKYIDLVGSADSLPIENGTADAILSSMVIEHLPDPEASFAEASRVLKSEGLLFLSYPYLYPIHAQPYDFARLSQFALDAMLDRHKFELVERRQLAGFWYMLGALTPIYIQGLPPVRALRLDKPFAAGVRLVCRGLHWLEGAALKVMKRDPATSRAAWVVTYVLVARRVAR